MQLAQIALNLWIAKQDCSALALTRKQVNVSLFSVERLAILGKAIFQFFFLVFTQHKYLFHLVLASTIVKLAFIATHPEFAKLKELATHLRSVRTDPIATLAMAALSAAVPQSSIKPQQSRMLQIKQLAVRNTTPISRPRPGCQAVTWKRPSSLPLLARNLMPQIIVVPIVDILVPSTQTGSYL